MSWYVPPNLTAKEFIKGVFQRDQTWAHKKISADIESIGLATEMLGFREENPLRFKRVRVESASNKRPYARKFIAEDEKNSATFVIEAREIRPNRYDITVQGTYAKEFLREFIENVRAAYQKRNSEDLEQQLKGMLA